MRKIVFDIETSNIFQDVGSNNPADLNLSVICIHDSETDEYSSYFQEDLPKLWPILEKADMFITFNGDHFDIPLLNKYYSGDLTKIKSLDLLKEMQKAYGRRMKLDQIAQGTLGSQKSGNGLDAIVWWREGDKEKVKEYCLMDVKLTKDLYEYAISNKKLIFKEGPNMHEVKLDTSSWEHSVDSALNHTLPW